MTIHKYVREIVLDTETTGLSHENGDRIVDVACVELMNHIRTGNVYQTYVNPQRQMHKEASAVSGITDDFLKDKPFFHEIADNLLNFIGNARLVIHNAKFDIGFLNCELGRLDKPLFSLNNIVDTLEIAREKYPKMPASLDALCKRFEIDISTRVTHGALVDCMLLAEVYINLLGGRQRDLSFSENALYTAEITAKSRRIRKERCFSPSEEEILAHNEFLKTFESPLWNKQ